jgi:hypothetical protein
MDESAVLLRQLDGYLAGLRPGSDPLEFAAAERLVAVLRCLIAETTAASAADRARVRAAVHYLVLRSGQRRTAAADTRVVNDILRVPGIRPGMAPPPRHHEAGPGPRAAAA